jgi:hypothetical protein
MTHFDRQIRPFVEAELEAAAKAGLLGNDYGAFVHLERAHVLGQSSTTLHVRVHWQMFCWGARRGNWCEMLGQLLRIIGAATKTAVGLVPQGNTGGTNVSPLRRMAVPPDLAEIIDRARAR